MCTWGTTRDVMLLVPEDLSHTENARARVYQIDECIADIVEALQANGIHMRGSCCGHDKAEGDIFLQDGRMLLVLSPEESKYYLAAGKRNTDLPEWKPTRRQQDD